MITRIKNGKLILDDQITEEKYLYFETNEATTKTVKGAVEPANKGATGPTNKITRITSEELPFDNEIDALSQYVSPGFIDLHVHGGNGFEFIDAAEEAIIQAANIHGMHGTTTIYPTLSAFSLVTTQKALDTIKRCQYSENIIPHIAGVHLEGPYFSPKQCGAQDTTYIREPDETEYAELVAQYGDLIRRWSYAPEVKGAVDFQDFLSAHHIVGAAGHTDAQYCHMREAYEHGCKLITHLYSCTSTIVREGGFRKLGVIETAYLYDDSTVEAIADGCHLPPELLKLIYKLKGEQQICLVTDAIRYGGCTGCEATVSGTENVPYIIEDGVAKLADRSAFAGSIATADVLVRTCTQKAGFPLISAVKMMTENPARVMGLQTKGRLKEGYDADIVLFDEDIQVHSVIVNGRKIAD